jgi:hypothetical protein
MRGPQHPIIAHTVRAQDKRVLVMLTRTEIVAIATPPFLGHASTVTLVGKAISGRHTAKAADDPPFIWRHRLH